MVMWSKTFNHEYDQNFKITVVELSKLWGMSLVVIFGALTPSPSKKTIDVVLCKT